jgi:hypothetical protein
VQHVIPSMRKPEMWFSNYRGCGREFMLHFNGKYTSSTVSRWRPI